MAPVVLSGDVAPEKQCVVIAPQQRMVQSARDGLSKTALNQTAEISAKTTTLSSPTVEAERPCALTICMAHVTASGRPPAGLSVLWAFR